MNGTPSQPCPRCGTPLPSATAACPVCLMAEAMKPTGGDAAALQSSPSTEELAPHFPQLEILACLGRGGMGVVYKARQKSLNRFVALKLLAPERVADAQFAERFMHEAQALAALSHPHIVTIHDFGQSGGFYFLLMEFVDGVNLRQAMRAGKFTPEQALAIVPPVCEALQYAHEHGIVHRDIKPENLLLDKDGRVKIADFGIAKMLGAESATGLAESQPAGTPQYMAPEQKEHRGTDHRADIYSLGVVLYEMLTGELPADKLQPPSRHVQVDVRIDEIVLRALEHSPEMRYATAADFRTQVEAVRTEDQRSIEPRLSRLAVSGACWVPVTPVALATVSMVSYQEPGGPARGPNLLQLIVLVPMLVIAVAGPFGTTILGWLAIGEIRRSQGKVRGLQLAVFDGLVYPVMALGAVIAVSSVALAKMFVDFYANPAAAGQSPLPLVTRVANWLSLNKEVAVVVGVVAAFLVNVLIVRAVMRAVRNETAASPPDGATEIQARLASLAVLFALMSTAFGAFAAMRSAGAWQAMAAAFFFAAVAIFIALPARRVGAGISAIVIAGLGMVIWPLVGLVAARARPVPFAETSGPEIESVEVNEERVVLKARGSDDAGMIFLFGNGADRWTPAGLVLESMFDVSLTSGGFVRGARWQVKLRHGRYSRYRLEGPAGSKVGKIVFNPGTPAPDADGAYVIGAFRPDDGPPLPIAVKVERTKATATLREKPGAHFPVGAHITRNHLSILTSHDPAASALHYVLFHEGDFGTTSSGTQNIATNTWTDEGAVKLKNGRTFGYRREALYPDELHLNGTRYDLREGRVIVLHDDGTAEQFRFFPTVATASDPEAVSHLIHYEEAEPEKKNDERKPVPEQVDLQGLSWYEFDQTEGHYWRSLSDSGRFAEAAELIERFLALHPELEQGIAALNGANLHFHAAQCRASQGDYERALKQIQAARHPQAMLGAFLWNEYLDGTAAFLRGDKAALQAARDKLAAGHDSNKPNVDALDRLLAHFGKSYAEAYRGGDSRELNDTERQLKIPPISTPTPP